MNHPLGGNKYFKLKYNLEKAKEEKAKTLITFGGAYSNHLLATSMAGKIGGFQTIGFVRGEELQDKTRNPTLESCEKNGMTLKFLTREQYRNKNQIGFLDNIKEQFPDSFLIPEGGTNDLAIKGTEEILDFVGEKKSEYTHICVASGTGGTACGVLNSLEKHQKLLVFPALLNTPEIQSFLTENSSNPNFEIVEGYQMGGYAKYCSKLITFVNGFKTKHKIDLDPIYVGKMMFGLFDLINTQKFQSPAKFLVIHSGGLQGKEGFNQELNKKNHTLLL
ncbi:MAG: 1-aminocyclopropane-1-carboxylate deaminase [Flavobacteriaceae bacterium]|nr:MAG: 1-aminocyclopropane-1-carboxylate deaminase [Flavobacteriaceae bacterium]